jgi:diaminohydroxyphosphoribosylaminopyrimidine deaminase/5-amino-6-(5-phosphoribosylamino)uracil reductase
MSRALQLARRGLYTTHPNPRVGCILVKDGQVIGEGWHEYAGGPHAEVNALNHARSGVTGATCYLTLEPCCHTGRTPPCTDVLIRAGVVKVIAATLDPNPAVSGRGRRLLEEAGIEVAVGLLEEESRHLNRGYMSRRTLRRPLMRCKMAMSLDGRTALADGASKWISGTAARRDVQRLRAESAAVMTGIGTVLADDPSLNVRDLPLPRNPLRVVVDPELKCPATAKMLRLPGRTLIVTADRDEVRRGLLEQAGAEVVVLDDMPHGFLPRMLAYLADKEEINEVLLESGATLAGSLLNAGLIDELILYQAPVVLGDGARGLFRLPLIADMADRVELEWIETRRVGEDLRLTLKVKKSHTPV